jgi:2-polyprenyl-6-hydroxyphenyl methylase / 3-demethylubiquinone-9 3-methyltransferase
MERRLKKARIHTGEVRALQPRPGLTKESPGMARATLQGTVDPAEVERFSALASEWWNPRGKMAPLHKFNPVRIGYVRDQAVARFGRDPKRLDSLKALRMLDIGCGGGLLSEPLARLGAEMVGVDPSEMNIEAAKEHASRSGLAIDYRCATAEELAEADEKFDVVLAMEVVEHVADVPLFVRSCAAMVKPDGLMIAATINRTLKSFALAIVGAEYILRWLPVGSHRWDKFVTPNELEIAMEQAGLRVTGEQGVIYNILADRWQLSSDTDVNYMLVAERSQ